MGWTSGFEGKADAVKYARDNSTWHDKHIVLAEKVTRLGYYLVLQDVDTQERRIDITIFEGSGRGIAIKQMCESMGPYRAVDCPLTFFALVAAPNVDAERWRRDCEAYHALRAAEAQRLAELKVTDQAEIAVQAHVAARVKAMMQAGIEAAAAKAAEPGALVPFPEGAGDYIMGRGPMKA